MSDIELLKQEIEDLKERLQRLEGVSSDDLTDAQKREIENGGYDFICDSSAIAYLWGCAPSSVKNGLDGTRDIKRLPGRRIRATKREVLAALTRRNQPVSIKAAKFISKTAARPNRKRQAA